jgi:hypothetical protein
MNREMEYGFEAEYEVSQYLGRQNTVIKLNKK